MVRKSQADNLAALEKAQGIARSGVTDYLLDQADNLIDRAVASLRSGTLSDRDAAVALAVVSELRSAANKAQQTYLKGIEAGEALTQGPTA
jgi:hypothetical protein